MDKSKLKQRLNFCYGFFGMLLIMGGIFLFENYVDPDGYKLLTLLATIPLAFVGIVLCATLIAKNKSFAIGVLVGGVTPIAYLFFMSRGCGLF